MISFGGVNTAVLHDIAEELVDFEETFPSGSNVPKLDRAWESPIYWLDRSFEIERFAPMPTRAFPGANLTKIALPTAYRLPLPSRFNELRWPSDASRWATMLLLIDSEGLYAIRKQAHGASGNEQNVLPLVIDSPEATTQVLTASMYLAQWVPLSQTPFNPAALIAENWYCMYLVDDRFYWPQVATPDFKIGPLTSWSSLFAKCATALGLPITVDPIPTSYFSPYQTLNLKYEILPPVLDAIAANVGMRITVDFQGNVLATSPTTAKTMLATMLANPKLKYVNRAGGVRMAGGI